MTYPFATLESLGVIQTGSTPSTSDESLWGGDVPFVTPAELDQLEPVFVTPRTLTDEGVAQAKVIKKDAVMVCCIGSLGKIGLAGRNLVTNQQINSIEFNSKLVYPKYGFYACQRLKPKLAAIAPATTVPIVNKSKFGQLEIPLPPLSQQHRIAAILDQADALRAKRREALSQLDRLAQSVFIEMFGDPATNPKGWVWRPLGSLAKKFSDGPFGSNLKSEHYVESGVRVVRLQNIGVGEFVDEDKAYISAEHFERIRKHECVPGDILVGTLGDPNLRACALPATIPLAINKADCVQIRVQETDAHSAFVCALLNHPSTEALAQALMHGQTRVRISMGSLRELKVPVPPLSLQREFAERIRNLDLLKVSQVKSAAEQNQLFASLQQRAFSGEL